MVVPISIAEIHHFRLVGKVKSGLVCAASIHGVALIRLAIWINAPDIDLRDRWPLGEEVKSPSVVRSVGKFIRQAFVVAVLIVFAVPE